MTHPSTPDVGRIERGIPLSQLYKCRWHPKRDMFVYRGKVILCAVCDLNEPPEPGHSDPA